MLKNFELVTGKGIRNDEAGSGEYGAKRGDRMHNGIDLLCEKNQPVKAPFNMYIEREARPSVNKPLSGVKWKYGKTFGYMFYFKPKKELFGTMVTQGTIIGYAQSCSFHYGDERMQDHIHFQIGKG